MKKLRVWVCLALALCCLPVCAFASSGGDPLLQSNRGQDAHNPYEDSASGAAARAMDYTFVRVLLSTRDGGVTVTPHGSYTVADANGRDKAQLQSGLAYTLTVTGSTVRLTAPDGTAIYATASYQLKEHTPPSGQDYNYFTLYNTDAGRELNYRGGLLVYAEGTSVQLVNRVGLEDYLKGVVGYEIGENYGAEALKAQAIAARSYAVCRIAARSAERFDLYDTSRSQVYRGAPEDMPKSAQAVTDTQGIVATVGGTPVQICYSGSNGGEIENAAHRWDGMDLPYDSVKADPYDLAYSQAHPDYAELVTFPKAPTGQEKVVGQLVTEYLLPQLQQQLDIEYMDESDIELTSLSMTARTGGDRIADGDSACTHLTGLSVSFSGKVKGLEFTDVGASFALADFDVSGSLGWFSNDELSDYWLSESETSYTLRHGRYGHGVGMSQIGARQMAQEGRSAQQILSFYYEGISLQQLEGIGQVVLPALPARRIMGESRKNARNETV